MKTLRTTALLLTLTLFFASCSEENDATDNEINFVSVEIPNDFKAPGNGRVNSEDIDEVTFEVTVITEDGTESVGYGRMIFPDDESISSFELSENIFTETGLDSDFWVNAVSDFSAGRVDATNGGCNCKELYEKGEGRGNCRLRCWGGVVIAVGVVVGAVLTNV